MIEMQNPENYDKLGKSIGLNKENIIMEVPNGTGPGVHRSERPS